jgi:GH25 family lysozyme M1 (1,4-beta-N-acetylmuramidase)
MKTLCNDVRRTRNGADRSFESIARPTPAKRFPFMSMAMLVLGLAMLAGPARALAQRPLGVDVSSYQGSITWSSAKGAGITFAWAKATEGTGYIDGYFTANQNNGKNAGVYMGAYHFAHPELNTPAAEAAYFWNEAGSYIKADGQTLMPMIDIEANAFSGNVGASSISDWINQWCNAVVNDAASAGVKVKPVIYVSACNAGHFNSTVAQWYPWIADWNGASSQSGTPWSVCSGDDVWGTWVVWQYADNASVSGISGSVDADVFNGSTSGLVSTLVPTSTSVNNAAYVSSSVPGSVLTGATFTATITLNNNGTIAWTSGGSNLYHLGSQSPQDNTTWGLGRVNLPSSPINAGQSATFTFTATAPMTGGTYTFAWQMVQEGVQWFGDTFSTTITVLASGTTLPADYAATADTTSPGFTQRVFQGGTATVSSIASAENLLGGFLINPATGLPFPNTAQTNTDGTWTFVQTNVLNYNISAPAAAGDFPGDVQYPGLPGANGSTINFALEAITYLYLTPGPYIFGVNSDDGFQLTCLDKQVGVFDAGRGAADTLFSFVVTQTGYYPFRLVYFQGGGGASLEWFSVTPSGQKILINDTTTPGYIPAYSRATTALPYFLGSWPGDTGNRPDQPVRVQMQNGVGIKVNTNSIRLTLNGLSVAPSITQTGGVTTVQYSTIWGSGSANTAMVWFADNEVSPVSQTNQFTFSVITYATIPASYALSAGAVDITKPGFAQKVFQTDQPTPYTLANAEIMLAGRLADAGGNLYPNKAAINTDGTYNYSQTNVINYNIAAPASAGDFSGDVQFPGIPGPSGSTNTFALEAITYLYLPVGYYVLGVNSDDGFRVSSAPNPHDEFPFQVAEVDGTHSAADTTGGFAITQAGYYPFRLVYFQATGPASLELFSVALSGQQILVNDTNTPGYVRAYRSATDSQPYVQWAYPYFTGSYFVSANNPVAFTLVNGTPTVQLNTLQLTFNGTAVTPSVTQPNGTNIVVSYVPSEFQQTANTTITVQLVWADTSGHWNTNAFSFVLYGSEALAPVWNIPPGYRPYLTNDTSATPTAMEAGMAYNPVTGHLILCSITNGTSVRGFYILDALTGNDVGRLKLTNASGTAIFAPSSTYPKPGYSVGVADDGAIYAADRKEGSFYTYKIYRWTNETSVVNLAYNEQSLHFAYSLGWDFRVRGAGTNTQIIVGAGLGGSGSLASPNAVLFTTTDGVNFTDKVIPISGIANDIYAGIAFGSNNTFYAEGFPGTVLRYVSYDPVAKTGSAQASYSWAAPAGSFGPLAVDLVNGRIVALATSATAGTAHTVNLFDINALATSGPNSPVDTSSVPTSNANPNGSGSVAFTSNGSMAFVLDSQNGLMAYELSVKTTPSLAARITQILYGNPLIISGTGPVSHPFALVSSTNVAQALNLWTPEQTNSAGTGSFSFSVAPGTVKAKFFRVVTQ